MEDKILLDLIKNEIELNMDCEVISIGIVQLLSPCAMYKAVFKEDFIYKPKFKYGTPETICFSEKSFNATYRVDLFECIKNYANSN